MAVISTAAEKTFRLLFRKRLLPAFGWFVKTGTVCFEPKDVLNRLLVDSTPNSGGLIEEECEAATKEIQRLYAKVPVHYPKHFGVGRKSSFLIYALVRSMRPSVVLETGVANGESSYLILKALSENNHGVLYSTDISSDVGDLLREVDKSRWRLRILDANRTKRSFEELLDEMNQVDLFIHDSGNHSYSLQMFEYRTVLRKMQRNSLLASDDVDASYAFIDFCAELRIRPLFLFEENKCFGVFRVG